MKKRFVVLLLPAALALAACGGDKTTGPVGVKPVLDSISPATGTVGTDVRIDGTAFSDSVPTVFFDALQSLSVEETAGHLYARAPQGLVAGAVYSVRVVNSGGKADTLAAAFTAVAPTITRVNGASKPTGLVGMTVIIEGSAFGDSPGDSRVYFAGAGGTPIQAAIADTANDWTNDFIVTSVPQSVADTSWIWVETPTGVSDSVRFSLIQSGTFSPSLINWTQTAPLPEALQGLGAVFVPVESGGTESNYIFTVGGADSSGTATAVVNRAGVQQSGALDAWVAQTPLAEPRVYAATAAATPYTAALDSVTSAALYVVGGEDSTGATVSSVELARVDPTGNVVAWQAGPPLPAPRHAGSATIFRGYLYYAGGADSTNAAQADVYRAWINSDGSLGAWESAPALPTPRSHFALVNFGPYIYAIGGETGTVTPTLNTTSGTETGGVDLSRINLRTGELNPWTAVTAMGKARGKHGAVFAGGALLVTSGVYSGQAGSSENTYAAVNNDGTINSWNGATGAETISTAIGISLYNQAVVTFIDANGAGHVLVLGGANRARAGSPSAAVIYY